MEIEDQRTPAGVTLAEAKKDPGVYEDMDGDLILVATDGSSIVLKSYIALTPESYWGKSTFRKVACKLVLLATLLVAACQPAQDNGFLTACDTAVPGPLDLDGECYEVTWPSTPLTVWAGVDEGYIDGDPGEVTQRAINRWEHRRPFSDQDLFIVVAEPYDADVVVVMNSIPEPDALDALGDARFWRESSGRLRAGVRTYNTASTAQLECVLFHELGHVLGLAHDEFGPMRPDGCGEPCDPSDVECMEGVGLVDVRVSDGDHRRLNRAY